MRQSGAALHAIKLNARPTIVIRLACLGNRKKQTPNEMYIYSDRTQYIHTFIVGIHCSIQSKFALEACHPTSQNGNNFVQTNARRRESNKASTKLSISMRTKNSTAKQTENKIKMPLTLFQQEDESISHDPNRYLYVLLVYFVGHNRK